MELLERDDELARLTVLLQSAERRAGQLIFIGGEPGIGKSSLVHQFTHAVADRARVLAVSCDGLSTPEPLGPLLDAAPKLGFDVQGAIEAGATRDQVFRGFLDALDPAVPTVLVGEDAHWSDEASLGMIRFLARHLDGRALLMIVTFRDDELGATHPLRKLLGDLATDRRVQRMGLLPLSEQVVHRLAGSRGLNPGELFRQTGGNPFFVSEVLSLGEAGVPASVRDIVLSRVARLSPEARAALETAAVIGSPVDLDLFSELAGDIAAEIEECVANGLLAVTEDELIFKHALTRDAVLSTISPLRRRGLHAAVLSALRARSGHGHDLSRLAHHAEGAGEATAALELARAAAEQANRLRSYREAASQYARALRFASSLSAREIGELHEARSIACHLSDQGGEAIAARRSVLEISRALGDRVAEGENLRWLSRLLWFDGRREEAEEAGRLAVDVLEQEPASAQLAMAYSNLSQLSMLAYDPEPAIRWGERAIALASALGERETLVHSAINVGTAKLNGGDPAGEAEVERALSDALEAGLVEHAARALVNLAWYALTSYDLTTAETRIEAALHYASEQELDNYRPYLLAQRAFLQMRWGDWDAALEGARPLSHRGLGSAHTQIVALTLVGTILMRRGEREADAALGEALRLAEGTNELQRLVPVRVARAERAWLQGDPRLAERELEPVRALAFAHGTPVAKSEVASVLHRIGWSGEWPGDLLDPVRLQLDGNPVAAAAAWDALGCPWEAAAARLGGGEESVRHARAAFERLGAAPAVALATRRLRELGARGIPRGPYAAARTNPGGLTSRELEVLHCLSDGLANGEIANRLYLSTKTVEHHVSSILAKLGVSSREAAVLEARRNGALKDQGPSLENSGSLPIR